MSDSLQQGIFPTQRSNPGLPTLRVDSLPSEPPGKSKNARVGSHSLLQEDLPDSGTEQGSPALQADSLAGKPQVSNKCLVNIY